MSPFARWFVPLLKAAVLLWLLTTLADGVQGRIDSYLVHKRYVTLVLYIGIWVVTYAAVLVASLLPQIFWRIFWGVVIATATAAGLFYKQLTDSFLSVLDIISLWEARHEAGRALQEFGPYAWQVLPWFLLTLLVIALPPWNKSVSANRFLRRLAWAPLIPVAMLVVVILVRPAGGWMGMPVQFQPLAVSIVGVKLAMSKAAGKRMAVPFAPRRKPAVRRIILLVDESIRADHLSFVPDNTVTPFLPSLLDYAADFGKAVSGSNCSNYSNAILRFTMQPRNMVESAHTYPTLWQWAKRAGFQTVYIDAQSIYVHSELRLQNFMTVREAGDIDELVHFSDVHASRVDMLVLDKLEELLGEKADAPLFIYVNKNGSHFPYDSSYPAEQRRFTPTISQAGADSREARINSYHNAIAWSVDIFFERLMKGIDLEDTVIIYTSDHGQNLQPKRLTHCSLHAPDPREGLVPMLVITKNEELLRTFRAAAQRNFNRTQHFHIAPTLLRLMGYAPQDLKTMYGPSLLDDIPADERPAFSHGDIFGLLSKTVRWKEVDTTRDYLEPEARTRLRRSAANAR